MALPGPGEFWSGVLVKESDGNGDGRVSADEFQAVAQSWFKKWDREGRGSLRQEDVAAGLNGLMPNFPPPPP